MTCSPRSRNICSEKIVRHKRPFQHLRGRTAAESLPGGGELTLLSLLCAPPLQVLGTPTREQIREMNPNYTEFKFPQIKAHPWTKVSQQVQEPFSFLLSEIRVMSERPPPCHHAAPSSLTPPPPTHSPTLLSAASSPHSSHTTAMPLKALLSCRLAVFLSPGVATVCSADPPPISRSP